MIRLQYLLARCASYNVDRVVSRTHTDYDGQGHAYLLTNYSAATGGTVVSQVQRAYNGLGQLTAEYQAHGAAVDTATTPKVQRQGFAPPR